MKVINAQVGGLNRYIRETMKEKSRLAASMKDEEASQNMCHI